MASPRALLSGVVLLLASPELRERVLGDVRLVAYAPGGALPAALNRLRRSRVARGVAAALVVAALAGGVAMLWGARPFTLAEGPAGPGPSTGATPDAPSSDPTTAVGAPLTGSTTRIGPSGDPTSVPRPGSTVPPGPKPSPVLYSPRPTPDTTTDPPPSPPPSPLPLPLLPWIVGQDASPSKLGLRGCPVARVAVRVTLAVDAPATAAVLSWKGAGGSGWIQMRGSGTTWSGSLGPFGERGNVQWSVTASNAAGSTTGPVDTIAVTSCTDPTHTR